MRNSFEYLLVYLLIYIPISRVGERGPNPRFSLTPSPNFGDGAGTGIRFGKLLGNFGDKTPKKLKIEPTLVPEKSPKVFQNLSLSLPRPQNSGTGTGKIGDWGPVPPP